jgi:hypothetical protein
MGEQLGGLDIVNETRCQDPNKTTAMKKFQVCIHFTMDEKFMKSIPAHRDFVNRMIDEGHIDHYAVSLETLRSWITFSAESRDDVEEWLSQSPLYSYWDYEIDELFVVDGHHYRLPALQLN